jgi:hypothetical protein
MLFRLTSGVGVQASEVVAIMAAIIYAGKRSDDRPGPELETRQAAVEEAWQIWQLTAEGWGDQSASRGVR